MPDSPYQPEFWSEDDNELWNDLAPILLDIYLQGVDGGVDSLPPDMRVFVDFDRVNTDALNFAKTYRYTLIKGITDTTRRQVQTAVSDWIQSGAPLPALESVLERTFGAVRANMISVTEATRVYAEGNAAAWESTGLVDEFMWNTAQDERVCVVCSARSGQIYSLSDAGNRPPAHIGDRCYMTPVVSKERLAEKLNKTLA